MIKFGRKHHFRWWRSKGESEIITLAQTHISASVVPYSWACICLAEDRHYPRNIEFMIMLTSLNAMLTSLKHFPVYKDL